MGRGGDEGGAELRKGAAAAEALSSLCAVLGVDEQAFLRCLTTAEVRAGKEGSAVPMFTKRLSAERAAKVRDGVARALYVKLFEYLVRLLNVAMMGGDEPTPHEPPRARSVSVVDFGGFEMLRVNSFEQVRRPSPTRFSRLTSLHTSLHTSVHTSLHTSRTLVRTLLAHTLPIHPTPTPRH